MYKKVLLVRPPCPDAMHGGWPPLGISYIAAYIAERSPEVTIKAIDYAVEEFSPEIWRRELSTFQPDVLGVTVLSVDAPNGMMLAQVAKEVDPGILTVCGGAHANELPEWCIQDFDIVVQGEGEESFYEILQENDLDTIKGIFYHRDGEVTRTMPRGAMKDLDSLPFPLLSLFDMERYIGPGWEGHLSQKVRSGLVLGSRGCPYKCNFCASQLFWDRTIRVRSAKDIVDEIELLQEKYQLSKIAFGDDLINVPRKRGFEICDEIIKRGLHEKLEFLALMRANKNSVSPELFVRMKEANFTTVSLGIESASQRVLKSMEKNLDPKEASQAIKMARNAGIPTVLGNFMVGNWDEKLSDVFKTWRFVLSNPVSPLFWISTPYPGTGLTQKYLDAGYLDSDYAWLGKIRSGGFKAISRTNTMSRPTITAVYFASIFLQIMVTLVRERRFKKFVYFGRRAGVEALRKLRPAKQIGGRARAGKAGKDHII